MPNYLKDSSSTASSMPAAQSESATSYPQDPCRAYFGADVFLADTQTGCTKGSSGLLTTWPVHSAPGFWPTAILDYVSDQGNSNSTVAILKQLQDFWSQLHNCESSLCGLSEAMLSAPALRVPIYHGRCPLSTLTILSTLPKSF